MNARDTYYIVGMPNGERRYIGRNGGTHLTARQVDAYAQRVGADWVRAVTPRGSGSPEDRVIDRRATFASRY